MDGQKLHNKDSDNQERMQAFFFDCLSGPGHQRLHFAGRIERRGGFKDDAKLFAIRVYGDNVIAQLLVSAAMVFVLLAVTEQSLVELADVVFRESQIFVSLEHQIHGFRVARDLLLVAGREGLHFDIGEKCFHLGVGELRPFNSGGGTNAFDSSHLAEGAQSIRRQGLEGVPTSLELIDFRDELDQILTYGEGWLPHRELWRISNSIPNYARLYPI